MKSERMGKEWKERRGRGGGATEGGKTIRMRGGRKCENVEGGMR